MKSICVFCGSSLGTSAIYRDGATALGQALGRRGHRLVFGGGRVGLMGVIADSVLAAGGDVVGIIPEDLQRKEIAHTGLTELRITRSMHERKAAMAEAADGFIALPGGFGTLDELCEILTWAQLGIHAKPIGLLDIDGFFAHLEAFFDFAVGKGFIRPKHRQLLLRESDPDSLLDRMAAWTPTTTAKWTEVPDP
ncbi:MAG: TIGR00730 family Rossman fold protein [Chloroflexota bacterium]|nr:TIGR00730 family Rossman fold protein [Chloroflexota bacterium]